MSSKRFDNRLEIKLPTFQGSEEDYFRLWELCVKAILRGNDIAEVLVYKEADKKTCKRA